MQSSAKIKVLVIRFSSIGDIVLCTPVIRCLKNIPDKDTEVHFLTKKSFAGFLSANPHIDKIHTLGKSLKSVITLLKQENYDYIVDLHNNLRSLRVKLALGKPSGSFNKLNKQKWLLTNFKYNRMPDIHIVDRYMAAAAPLGIKNDHKGLDFFIPHADKIKPEDLPEGFGDGYTAFVIGGTYATKRLPDDMIVDICRKLLKPVILLGGPEDADAGYRIAAAVGQKVFNACGKYSLNASASLVEQATAIISHDTGLMHIAAAFGKPVASVWGNTVPELGMYPYQPGPKANASQIFEVRELSCRPCSKIGYNQCPKKHFRCMKNQDINAIAQWANNFAAVQKTS